MTAPTVHASAVRLGGDGVLVTGRSGSGKSALVLALIDGAPESARLIADDRVVVAADGGRLIADAPAALAGLLEIRGQGIVRYPHAAPAAITLVVELRPPGECPRYPAPEEAETIVAGVRLPRLILPEGAADGAVRVRAALRRLAAGNG
jgi:serine kinase of HPr protein (carbohydrate metabolism regulator)